MHKHILIISLVSLLAFGCNQKEIERLEKQNRELAESNHAQDSLLNDFMGAFNNFEENLQLVKEKENLIAEGSSDPELRVDGKEKIIQDIQMINDLLDQNRQIIADLNDKLARAEGKTGEFRRMVASLKRQLEEKDGEVTGLKEELVAMNFTVESLNGKIDTLSYANAQLAQVTESQTWRIAEQDSLIGEQTSTIDDQTTELNTAYYITGTYKELKRHNILTKSGGFIGIGGSKTLIPDFDQSMFTKIDITEIQSIPVDTKKAEIVSVHPSDSYVFNQESKTIESLEITDPDRFWKSSKYLVLVTN